MFKHYQMTILEEFVENLYYKTRITEPEQLTVKELSRRLNVWVHYAEVTSRALEAVPGMYSMFLDSRLSAEQQQMDFLHELCHLLRHAGNQMIMPTAFTLAQESEAEIFVLYASMPFSMISQIEIPDQRIPAIHRLVEIFNVSSKVAEKRLDQIQRRCLQGMLDATVRDFEVNKQKNINNWSTETQRVLKQLNRQLIAKGLSGYEDKGLI